MSLFELSVSMPASNSPSSSPNLQPLVESNKEIAKSNNRATNDANYRYTDNRQISAEEKYGLINNWQSAFNYLGVWSVEQIQRTGTKINDSKYNYILLDKHYYSNYTDRGEKMSDASSIVSGRRSEYSFTEHYLAHVSTDDPYLMEQFLKVYRTGSQLYGSDMIELIALGEFKEKVMPSMKFGWIERA